MKDSWDIANVITAGLSAVAALGAWFAAARANKTSRQAQDTAEAVARIERDRRHEERRPRLELSLGGPYREHSTLNVHLAGPDELGEVEIVSIRVDDDDKDRTSVAADDETRAQIAAHVWGPYRFTPRVDGADENGRAIGPFSLKVGRGRPFQMDRTRPGVWMTGRTMDAWQEEYLGHPVRLVITCRSGGDEWVLARALANESW